MSFGIKIEGGKLKITSPVIAKSEEFFIAAANFTFTKSKRELAKLVKKENLKAIRSVSVYRNTIYIQKEVRKGIFKATVNVAKYDANQKTKTIEIPIVHAFAFAKFLYIKEVHPYQKQ